MIRQRNLEKIKKFRQYPDNWSYDGSNQFDSKYLDYVEEIFNCIDEELQPEVFPIPGDFPLVQLEWGSIHSSFYLEMTVNLFNIYEIYYCINDEECKENDGFSVTIKKENLNSLLKLLLNNTGWIEYYNKYRTRDNL